MTHTHTQAEFVFYFLSHVFCKMSSSSFFPRCSFLLFLLSSPVPPAIVYTVAVPFFSFTEIVRHKVNHIPEYFIWYHVLEVSVQFSSVAQSCLTLCDPMNRSTPGLPVVNEAEVDVFWNSLAFSMIQRMWAI